MKQRKRRHPPWTYMIGEHMFRESYFPKTYMGRIAIDIICELEARTRKEIKDERWAFFSVPYYAWMYGVSERTIQRAFVCLESSDLIKRVDDHNEARLWITSKGVKCVLDIQGKGDKPITPGVTNGSPLKDAGVTNESTGVTNQSAGVTNVSSKEDSVEESIDDFSEKEDEVQDLLQKTGSSDPAAPVASEPFFAKTPFASQPGAVAPEPPLRRHQTILGGKRTVAPQKIKEAAMAAPPAAAEPKAEPVTDLSTQMEVKEPAVRRVPQRAPAVVRQGPKAPPVTQAQQQPARPQTIKEQFDAMAESHAAADAAASAAKAEAASKIPGTFINGRRVADDVAARIGSDLGYKNSVDGDIEMVPPVRVNHTSGRKLVRGVNHNARATSAAPGGPSAKPGCLPAMCYGAGLDICEEINL